MLGDLGWPKTRVNLRIRAHITTYYHLQIVITNDHRLGMALAMDNRTHSLACTVCMIHTLLEPWLLWPGSGVCDKNCRNAYITFWSLSFLILVRDDVQDVVNWEQRGKQGDLFSAPHIHGQQTGRKMKMPEATDRPGLDRELILSSFGSMNGDGDEELIPSPKYSSFLGHSLVWWPDSAIVAVAHNLVKFIHTIFMHC